MMQSGSKQAFGRLCLVTTLVLSFVASAPLAQAGPSSRPQVGIPSEEREDEDTGGTATTQRWRAGWDDFDEQLDYNASRVTWRHRNGTPRLHVTYVLRGATPNRQYQVGIHLLDRCGEPFGQFPLLGPCGSATREGVTRTVESIEFGVVTTDSQGNGSFSVQVNRINSGTYELEFHVRAAVGCRFNGCGTCDVAFQSPGPFGAGTTTITFP